MIVCKRVWNKLLTYYIKYSIDKCIRIDNRFRGAASDLQEGGVIK